MNCGRTTRSCHISKPSTYQITEQIKNSPPNLTLISHITSKLIKPAAASEKFESLAGGIP